MTKGGVPSGLTANAVSAWQIILTWTNLDGGGNPITGYNIQRSDDNGATWQSIGQTNNQTTKYSDENLQPTTTYFYRVFVTTSAGQGPPSNTASAATCSAPNPMTLSTNIENVTNTSILYAPLEVGFYLTGDGHDTSNMKRWYFGDDDGYVQASDYVFTHTYKDLAPPEGFQAFVEIGYYQDGSIWVRQNISNTVIIHTNQPPPLYFLSGNKINQWKGYLTPGDSVGISVSLDEPGKLTWRWNDPYSQPNEDEINSIDQNPSHKYTQLGSYQISLQVTSPGVAGEDDWFFFVLVIPEKDPSGDFTVASSDGNSILRTTVPLNFSVISSSLPVTKLPRLGEGQEYCWFFYSLDPTAEPTHKSGDMVSFQYTKGGNYKVVLCVTDQSGTPWLTIPKNITILDAPSITPQPSPDWKHLTVTGKGFPTNKMVDVSVVGYNITGQGMSDSSGQFETISPLDISSLEPGNYNVIAQSGSQGPVSSPFTIPQQSNVGGRR